MPCLGLTMPQEKQPHELDGLFTSTLRHHAAKLTLLPRSIDSLLVLHSLPNLTDVSLFVESRSTPADASVCLSLPSTLTAMELNIMRFDSDCQGMIPTHTEVRLELLQRMLNIIVGSTLPALQTLTMWCPASRALSNDAIPDVDVTPLFSLQSILTCLDLGFELDDSQLGVIRQLFALRSLCFINFQPEVDVIPKLLSSDSEGASHSLIQLESLDCTNLILNFLEVSRLATLPALTRMPYGRMSWTGLDALSLVQAPLVSLYLWPLGDAESPMGPFDSRGRAIYPASLLCAQLLA